MSFTTNENTFTARKFYQVVTCLVLTFLISGNFVLNQSLEVGVDFITTSEKEFSKVSIATSLQKTTVTPREENSFLIITAIFLFLFCMRRDFYYFANLQPILDIYSKHSFVGSLSPPNM